MSANVQALLDHLAGQYPYLVAEVDREDSDRLVIAWADLPSAPTVGLRRIGAATTSDLDEAVRRLTSA